MSKVVGNLSPAKETECRKTRRKSRSEIQDEGRLGTGIPGGCLSVPSMSVRPGPLETDSPELVDGTRDVLGPVGLRGWDQRFVN